MHDRFVNAIYGPEDAPAPHLPSDDDSRAAVAAITDMLGKYGSFRPGLICRQMELLDSATVDDVFMTYVLPAVWQEVVTICFVDFEDHDYAAKRLATVRKSP
jgi:hypothetical protein